MPATENIVTIEGKYYGEGTSDLANGEHLDIDPADATANAVRLHSFIHGGDCDVVFRKDSTGDGTFDVEVTIDSLTGSGISQANTVEAGENAREMIRITNTSGSAADFAVTGVQLSQ